jgi:hypothetical protein
MRSGHAQALPPADILHHNDNTEVVGSFFGKHRVAKYNHAH